MIKLQITAAALLLAALASAAPGNASQDNPQPAEKADLSGLHAFDLRVGTWQVHHRRLKERLAGSKEWVEFDGTQTTWPLMDGWANVDENLFRMPSGDYRGVSLRAYDPKTGQWAIWWLDGRNPFGELDPPVKGRFVNGVGTFYADDTLRGKPIRVRFTWSNITATSGHWEQAFSPDGGKTWETNWITDFRPAPSQNANLSGPHDFDFLVGQWQVHHRRLKERLADNHEWVEFEGTCSNRPLMDGWSNVDENLLKMPSGEYRGVGLRAYDPKTGQWAIWWLDSRNPFGDLDPPVKGGFKDGVGTFYADDTLRGKPIRVRFTWSNITPTSARWEQAFSPDGGKTWEVNWTMEFRRTSSAPL